MQLHQPLSTEFVVCYLALGLRLSLLEYHAVWSTFKNVAKATFQAESVRASPEWLALRREFPDYDETQPNPIPRFVWPTFGPELLCTGIEMMVRKSWFYICNNGIYASDPMIDPTSIVTQQWAISSRYHFVQSVRYHLLVLALVARVGRAIDATGVNYNYTTVSLAKSFRVSWSPKLRLDDVWLHMRVNSFGLMVELSHGDEAQHYYADIVGEEGLKFTAALDDYTEDRWVGTIARYFKKFSDSDPKPVRVWKSAALRRDASPHRK